MTPESITQENKKLVNNLMMELSFLCEKKILARLEQKETFALMCFVMKTS